jgi:hypothetical protein
VGKINSHDLPVSDWLLAYKIGVIVIVSLETVSSHLCILATHQLGVSRLIRRSSSTLSAGRQGVGSRVRRWQLSRGPKTPSRDDVRCLFSICSASQTIRSPAATFDKRIDYHFDRDYIAGARTRYGEVAWSAGEQVGTGLSREQAIAYALGERTEMIQPQTKQAGDENTIDPRSDEGKRGRTVAVFRAAMRLLAT